MARHDGRVIFVRGAVCGELVDLRVTQVRKRFARAEVIAVRRSSEHRIEPGCPNAGRCGGCDFQHIESAFSRELKRRVVAEQLQHLAGFEFVGPVAEVAPSRLAWRSRMRYQVDQNGRAGLLAHRSQEIVPLPAEGCAIAMSEIASPPVSEPTGQLIAAVAKSGAVILPEAVAGQELVEQAHGRDYRVRADGFWQPHLTAADLLVAEVLDGLAPVAGEVAVDLYCGVGPFAGALASAGCQVLGIEADRQAVELAKRNVPEARFLAGDVNKLVERLPLSIDLAVLDPPRVGAGADVLAAVLARRPRAVAYVACEPAALGRDLRIATDLGYRCEFVNAFDLFPQTHHVECIAVLKPS